MTHGSARSSAARSLATKSPDVVSRLIEVYLERRDESHERFIDVVDRLGLEPFKERVYAHLD